jgi:hypothetical protein
MQVSGQLQEMVAISPAKGVTRRVAEPQGRSSCLKKKNSFAAIGKK